MAGVADLCTADSGVSRSRLDRRCPNCQGWGMRLFYQTGEVPVHSCLMLTDERAARGFPHRPMRLGVCGSCGFVANVDFDPTVHQYADQYEDQQSFSPRFREFQTGLIDRLIRQFDLRNKDIVEIGCGKGDFLVELCRTGGNRGIGIDPRSRVADGDGQSGIRFIPEFYSPSHRALPCDFLCCRHTLEHLHETDRFMAGIAEALVDRPQTVVFFEVPDATRVFREQAFWDIYYEHCSYFTPDSLAAVFRRNGFDILDLAGIFEGQYLLIAARPAGDPTTQTPPAESVLNRFADEIDAFEVAVPEKIKRWRERIAAMREAGKRIAVWGAGSKCVSFLSTLGCAEDIESVVDINPHQQNKYLPGSGKQIRSPESLRRTRPEVVLVMNPVYREEIARQLEAMGASAEIVPLQA